MARPGDARYNVSDTRSHPSNDRIFIRSPAREGNPGKPVPLIRSESNGFNLIAECVDRSPNKARQKRDTNTRDFIFIPHEESRSFFSGGRVSP